MFRGSLKGSVCMGLHRVWECKGLYGGARGIGVRGAVWVEYKRGVLEV